MRCLSFVAALAVAACSGSKPAPQTGDPEPKPKGVSGDDAALERFRSLMRESPPAYAEADTYARKQCEAGVEAMCARLGRLHALPVFPGSDPAKALAGFEASCSRGYQRGCVGVGKVIMVHETLGEKAGGAKRALALFEKGCESGVGEGCYYLGMFHYMGRHVPKDLKRAVALLKQRVESLAKACDEGFGYDCGLLAEAYASGQIFSDESFTQNPDQLRAGQFATKGCAAGHGGSCLILGQAALPSDRTAAIDLFAKGCELLDADSCTQLAKHGSSEAERPRLFRRACDLGGGIGCFALAEASGQGGEDPAAQAKARAQQLRGCALRYPPSCRFHAQMLRVGHGGGKDPQTARSALVRVCQMIERGTFCSDPECLEAMTGSCADAGEMMKTGEGGPVDEARAKALLKIACDRGATKACEKPPAPN